MMLPKRNMLLEAEMSETTDGINESANAEGEGVARMVADRLRGRILARFAPGQRLPTERTLARELHRCRSTVRKALAILEREGLLRRVQGSGTYVTDRLARSTGTTGLVFIEYSTVLLDYAFAREAYRGILKGTEGTERYVHLLMGVGEAPAITEQITNRFDLKGIDSLVCLEVFAPRVFETLARRLPVVSVDFACSVPGVSSCALDHRHNLEIAVEHLWTFGHRRIGLAGVVDTQSVDPARSGRYRGYIDAMRKRSLPLDDEWVKTAGNAPRALSLMRHWQATPPNSRPTAIICTDAPWLLASAAVELGVNVPAELSLLSLGKPDSWLSLRGSEWTSELAETQDVHEAHTGESTDPTAEAFAPLRDMLFTSVSLPFRQMGQWAMEEVLRRVGRPDLPPQHEVFAGHVTPGNTATSPASNLPRTGVR